MLYYRDFSAYRLIPQKVTADLESRGYRMLVKNKKEPWGQTVSRFLSPEGLLVGITFTPSMREEAGIGLSDGGKA
jgi:hypothetical protein